MQQVQTSPASPCAVALRLLLAPLLLLTLALGLLPAHSHAVIAQGDGFIPDGTPGSANENGTRSYGRFLVLRPVEYSRYEISPEGHVVVYFPLGVEGWYMGYHLKAGQLRYDQATEAASLAGGVVLNMPGCDIITSSILLDGRSGRGVIPGALSGYYHERGLTFQAGRAELGFPADFQQRSDQLGLRDFSLNLLDRVRATDRLHNTLLAGSLQLSGPAGQLISPGPFQLLVSAPRDEDASAGTYGNRPAAEAGRGPIPDLGGFSLYPVLLDGQGLNATLEEDGIGLLTVYQPLLRATDWLLRADQAQLYIPALSSSASDAVQDTAAIRLSGGPVLAVLRQENGRKVQLSADSIALLSLAGRSQSWQLEGAATVDSPGGRFSADALNVTSDGESYTVELPEGIDLDFNLSAISDGAGLGGLTGGD